MARTTGRKAKTKNPMPTAARFPLMLNIDAPKYANTKA
jgi:hypothetical protein